MSKFLGFENLTAQILSSIPEHWKNFLRMHINEAGDLEIFSIGLHRVPKKWIKDPSWGGKKKTTTPSWSWKRPSKWIPQPNSKNCMPVVVDYTKIKKSSSVNEQY